MRTEKAIECVDLTFLEIKLQEIESKVRNENLKPKNDHYTRSYPSLIKAVRRIRRCRKHRDLESLLLIAHVAYGWMPTIIKSDFKNEEASFLWKKIASASTDDEFLSKISKCINDSIIGASKFLHFINPDEYAIWDSRVYQSIIRKNSTYTPNRINCFIFYTKKLRKLSKEFKVMCFKRRLRALGYCDRDTSHLRVIELILFLTSP
ncbi:MAG: hypothetical protein GDA55_08085 [Cellvibrionales bacterium]|nr:hypothetical protein [Cellvibrionales bacterium]